jgi:hypothetical protein
LPTAPPPPAAAGGQLPGVAQPMVQALCCQGLFTPGINKSALLCGEALEQLRPWAAWYLVHAAVAPQQVSCMAELPACSQHSMVFFRPACRLSACGCPTVAMYTCGHLSVL